MSPWRRSRVAIPQELGGDRVSVVSVAAQTSRGGGDSCSSILRRPSSSTSYPRAAQESAAAPSVQVTVTTDQKVGGSTPSRRATGGNADPRRVASLRGPGRLLR